MKKLLVLATLLTPSLASAQFVLGSGTTTCADAVNIWENGEPLQVGELAGWVLGFWTRETFERDQAFTDILKTAGGRRIMELTIDECAKAPEDILLYQVTLSIIRNTG